MNTQPLRPNSLLSRLLRRLRSRWWSVTIWYNTGPPDRFHVHCPAGEIHLPRLGDVVDGRTVLHVSVERWSV